MDYQDIYHVESFLINSDQEPYANKLLKNGWVLLGLAHHKIENEEYSKYSLGATKAVYERYNFDNIREELNNVDYSSEHNLLSE